MIVVAAIMKTAECKGEEFEQEFRKLAPKVLKDPGTISYVLNRSIDTPTKFLVYEKYEDRDALRQHGSTAHFKDFSRAIASMLDGRPEVSLYEEIA